MTIMDAASCEAAARFLGKRDTSVNIHKRHGPASNRPAGCTYHHFENLELWTESTGVCTFGAGCLCRVKAEGYTRHKSACINGHNIAKFKNKSLQECKAICDGLEACKAFEYGVDYGKRQYEAGDCNPQDTAEGVSAGCGNHNNLDTYVKDVTINTNSEVKCANEGGQCSCNGHVRYGAVGGFSEWRTVSGSIACNNGVFGDPLPGTVKACYCRGDLPSLHPTADPTNSPSLHPTADPTNSAVLLRQTGESCGSCFCPPTFSAGQCAPGNVCVHSRDGFADMPGTCMAGVDITWKLAPLSQDPIKCSDVCQNEGFDFCTETGFDNGLTRNEMLAAMQANGKFCSSFNTDDFGQGPSIKNTACSLPSTKGECGRSVFDVNGLHQRLCPCANDPNAVDPNAELREAMRRVFKQVKESDRTLRLNMPALIRKSFHDAGHFDDKKNKMEMRMGCIKHFFGQCPQHDGLQDAERFRQEVCNGLRREGFTCPSFSDMVQLLGALAVDEMTPAHFNRDSLFDKVPMGRVDTSDEVCMRIGVHEEEHMCKLLPNVIGPNKRNRRGAVREALEETFQTEIAGKMIERNSFTAREAIALIGAHTVGHHHGFGAWVENPMDFDNAYFQNLELIGNRVGHGKSFTWNPESMNPRPRYSQALFPTWFQDSAQVENSSPQENERNFFKGKFGFNNIMMLSSDMALITNAWDLVQEFAGSEDAWRRTFDEAYLKMGMLGVDKSTLTFPPAFDLGRRNLASEEDLDREAEFFQNLEIAREETVAELRQFHARRLRNDHVAKADGLHRRA